MFLLPLSQGVKFISDLTSLESTVFQCLSKMGDYVYFTTYQNALLEEESSFNAIYI